MSTNEIRTIDFHGDKILARAAKGRRNYEIVFKPLCELFRVQFAAQLKKLKRSKWATVSIMDTVGADGKPRRMVVISRKTFLHWLMTIDTRRIKDPEVAAKILRY